MKECNLLTWQASMLWVINLTMLVDELVEYGSVSSFCNIPMSHHSISPGARWVVARKTKTVVT